MLETLVDGYAREHCENFHQGPFELCEQTECKQAKAELQRAEAI